LIDLLDSKF